MPPDPRFSPDAETLPGIHGLEDVLQLRRENDRLRRERDEARAELAVEPPPLPGRGARVARSLGKYAVLLPAFGLAARALARRYPEVTPFVDSVLDIFGL